MANISYDEGVPIIFIISTNWSIALFPGKIGSNKIVSAITQAKLIYYHIVKFYILNIHYYIIIYKLYTVNSHI